jgi:hypothetical protein
MPPTRPSPLSERERIALLNLTADGRAILPVPQPLSEVGAVVIQRPQGISTVTAHTWTPAPAVEVTPGDPHGPHAPRPDALPNRPGA